MCGCGHPWKAAISNRSNGNNCPVCTNKVVIVGKNDLGTLRPDIAHQWDKVNNGALTPEQVTVGSSRKVWWICKRGHNFEATIVARTHGSRCPYCVGKRPIVGETDFATVHPELLDEWDYGRNKKYGPQDITAASHKELWWRCAEGHRWKAPAYHRHAGSKCPVCAKLKDNHIVVVGVNDLATIYPHIAEEWDDSKNVLTPRQVMPGANGKFWWECLKCGHGWLASVQSRTTGSKCPRCYGKIHTKTRFIT
jgi:DNA-directed RNA polymerase subunit RPC12/RpoP